MKLNLQSFFTSLLTWAFVVPMLFFFFQSSVNAQSAGTNLGPCRTTEPKCDSSLVCIGTNPGVCMTPNAADPLNIDGKSCSDAAIKAQCTGAYTCDAANNCVYKGQSDVGVTTAKLDGRWYDYSKSQNEKAIYSDPNSFNGNQYLHNVVSVGLVQNLNTMLGGVDPENQNLPGLTAAEKSGAVGQLASAIGATYQPPISTAEYIADVGRQAGFVQTAYAQGTGWQALSVVLPIWKAFRNIAYMGFVIIFLVVGFMIMFRAKLGQQAVVTIQLALPQIIITLLLITFSYAIASLMIDLIYFLIYLIVSVFQSAGIITAGKVSFNGTPLSPTEIILNNNIIQLIWGLINPSGIFSGNGGGFVGNGTNAVATIVNNLITSMSGKVIGSIASFLTGGIVYLILIVAVIISMFKLWFQLIIAYISIIFQVIFAPILLLFNALPGSQSFSKWLKSLFASAILFPVTALLMIVGSALVGSDMFGSVSTGYSNTSGVGSQLLLPFLGGLNTTAIQGIIGVGFIMFLPKITEAVQKMLGVEGGISGMMGAVMEPIGAGWGTVSAPGRLAGRAGGVLVGAAATVGSQRFFDKNSGRITAGIGRILGRNRGSGSTDMGTHPENQGFPPHESPSDEHIG